MKKGIWISPLLAIALLTAGCTEKTPTTESTGEYLDDTAVTTKVKAALAKDPGLKTLVDKNKVAWVQGRGRLEGPGRVRVSQSSDDGTPGGGGDRLLQANDIILATGSRVKSLPGLEPDGERIVTSDDVLRRPDAPKSIVIVGAGAVGVEFASFYHDLEPHRLTSSVRLGGR